jgi:hypothetical protein
MAAATPGCEGAESLNNTLDRALYGGRMIAYSPFAS